MLKLDSILEGVAELTGSRLANGSLLALPSSSWNFQSLLQRRRERGGGEEERKKPPYLERSSYIEFRICCAGASDFGNRSRLHINRNWPATDGVDGKGNLELLSLFPPLSPFVLIIAYTYVHTKWHKGKLIFCSGVY